MIEVPHFSLPFRFATPNAAVVEQDSIDEISHCVIAIMLCPLGFRIELPEFGISDLTFDTQPLNIDEVRLLVEEWEPRASTSFTQETDDVDELIARVSAQVVAVRTQE